MMRSNEQLDMNAVAKELGYRNAEELCEALWKQKGKSIEELIYEDLTDIRDIGIDESFPLTEQVVLLLKQTPNPFYYRYEGMIVKISETGEQLLNRILEEILWNGEGSR